MGSRENRTSKFLNYSYYFKFFRASVKDTLPVAAVGRMPNPRIKAVAGVYFFVKLLQGGSICSGNSLKANGFKEV